MCFILLPLWFGSRLHQLVQIIIFLFLTPCQWNVPGCRIRVHQAFPSAPAELCVVYPSAWAAREGTDGCTLVSQCLLQKLVCLSRPGLPTSALLPLGCWWFCPVPCRVCSYVPGLHHLDASSIPFSCGDHKCLGTLPDVPRRGRPTTHNWEPLI